MARGGARTKETAYEKRAEGAALAEALQRRRRFGRRGGLALALLIGIGALVVLDSPPPGVAAPLLAPSHISAVDDPHVPYTSTPPSSGAHTGGMPPAGLVVEAPIEPEAYLHFMEDGGIGMFYDCPAQCPDIVDGLAVFMNERPNERLFMAPFDGITDDTGTSHRVAAVAWGRILYLDTLSSDDLAELGVFVSIFEGVDHHAG